MKIKKDIKVIVLVYLIGIALLYLLSYRINSLESKTEVVEREEQIVFNY
jgi:hypothetical protein